MAQNFYSVINDETFIIQGRSNPLEINDVVPMGIKTANSGNYTIAIAYADGVFENGNQTVYLLDKLNNTYHNLTLSSYNFSSNQGIINDRFELHYTNTLLNNTSFEVSANQVTVFSRENNIEIKSTNQNINSITIYDILGRTLENKKDINTTIISVDTIQKNNQPLLVKVYLNNGQLITRKIIY